MQIPSPLHDFLGPFGFTSGIEQSTHTSSILNIPGAVCGMSIHVLPSPGTRTSTSPFSITLNCSGVKVEQISSPIHCSEGLVEWCCFWSHGLQAQSANQFPAVGTQIQQKRQKDRKKQLTNPRGTAMNYIIARNAVSYCETIAPLACTEYHEFRSRVKADQPRPSH